MAHIWFMHDAHLGRAFLFLDMLAEYTLLSMTIMATPCLWYVVGMKLVCPMSKISQAPFARAPFGECRGTEPETETGSSGNRRSRFSRNREWNDNASELFLRNRNQNSEQLPCRSAEVKFFSFFLCQRCREIWHEILVKFSVLRFPGFGCATENFTKISCQKRCEKRKISRKFHSAGAQR